MTAAAENPDDHGGSVKLSVWQTPWMNALGRFLALVVVFAFFAIMVEDGRFYTSRNLENIVRQSAVYATAALGMTMVIIAGGIDLSIGSIIALAVVVVAWVLNLPTHTVAPDGTSHAGLLYNEWPTLLPMLALLAGVVAATIAGLANGCMIVGLRLVPFIVTLGTMGIFRGIAKGIAQQKDIYPPHTWLNDIHDPTVVPFLDWLNGKAGAKEPTGLGWLVLPLSIWILLVASIGAVVLLRYTRFGRHIFAIGSNEETARLCGVNVEQTKILVYMLAGFFGGLAAIMLYSDIGGIGQPTSAIAYELFVIAAVVIGGGSLLGGEGSVLGSLIGALIITILYMGGKQVGWEQWRQEVVIGAIIVAAATLDRIRHRAMN
jgi:ribose transport system permease protein/erythritol transport system permease protein